VTNPFSYGDRRVVVTGGASGVGAALLDRLAELGATAVTVLDRAKPEGPHDQFIEVDLSSEAAVASAAAEIDGSLAALFNNAGVANTMASDVVFAVNHLALRKLTDLLEDQLAGGGAVVNTASIAGMGWSSHLAQIQQLLAIDGWDERAAWFADRSDVNGDPYGFTKECLQVLTMQEAKRLGAKGIRINAACPGPIQTPLLVDFRATMTDKMIDWSISQGDGQIVTADDVACILAFLGSDAARSLSGTNLPVDRGFSGAMTTGQADLSGLF
jgi:NAD(P)-dependent dehydrogenase (short-subunit alcohol dehydrogenase family)